MIEKVSRDIIEKFWKIGILPNKSTIRIEHINGEKYRIFCTGLEIPLEFLNEETPESLQAMMDAMPNIYTKGVTA